MPASLRLLLNKIRAPFKAWTRVRLWHVYDRVYPLLFGHDQLHRNWLQRNQLTQPIDSLFSIGPGLAKLELELCQANDCPFGYAEPNTRYYKHLEETFSQTGLNNCIVERHHGQFQHFDSQHKWSLILSIHSWYAFGRNRDILQKTLAMLKPGGSLLISITSNEDFFYRNALTDNEQAAEDLSTWAKENGFEHDFEILRFTVPQHLLVKDNTITEDAKGVVSFLKGRLWWRIPAQERARIEQRLLDLPANGEITRAFGLLHFRSPDMKGHADVRTNLPPGTTGV